MEFLLGGCVVLCLLGVGVLGLGTLAGNTGPGYGDWTLLLIVYVCMHICVCMSVHVHV